MKLWTEKREIRKRARLGKRETKRKKGKGQTDGVLVHMQLCTTTNK